MPVSLPVNLFLIAIVEGIGIVVGSWWACGGCWVDVTGGYWRVLIQVVFMASVPILSAGHGWIWVPSVLLWDLDMKKHQRLLAGAGGSVGMVGVLGEEGPSWTSSIVTHFTDDACRMIDQSAQQLFIFLCFFAFQPPIFCPFFGPFDGLLRLLPQRFEVGQAPGVGEIVTKSLNFQKGS